MKSSLSIVVFASLVIAAVAQIQPGNCCVGSGCIATGNYKCLGSTCYCCPGGISIGIDKNVCSCAVTPPSCPSLAPGAMRQFDLHVNSTSGMVLQAQSLGLADQSGPLPGACITDPWVLPSPSSGCVDCTWLCLGTLGAGQHFNWTVFYNGTASVQVKDLCTEHWYNSCDSITSSFVVDGLHSNQKTMSYTSSTNEQAMPDGLGQINILVDANNILGSASFIVSVKNYDG
jgi:hypothetical protein